MLLWHMYVSYVFTSNKQDNNQSFTEMVSINLIKQMYRKESLLQVPQLDKCP